MAHGLGHEHGPSKMELPDYKQWKIEGTPLETVQEKLAARGLRDPWGCNEAWRYRVALQITFPLLEHY